MDFLDEACPISSEDGEGEATDNDHPSGSGEEDAGPMAVDEPQLLPESICMSLPGPSTCSYLSVGQVGSKPITMHGRMGKCMGMCTSMVGAAMHTGASWYAASTSS